MGKTKLSMWKCYKDVSNDNYKCNFCDQKFKKNATRQKKHLKSVCSKIPESIKKELFADLMKQGSVHSVHSIDKPSENENSPSGSSSSNIQNFFDKMDLKEKKILDEKLAKAIFVTGTPMDMVSHPLWIDFFHCLRPSYTLPSRKTISSKLLDIEYSKTDFQVKDSIEKATSLTLQVDYWSNVRNDSIANYVINTPKPVLFKTTHTKANRHNHLFLAEEIERVLLEIGPNKFFGLITDCGGNIKKARAIIALKYPHLVEYGCVCHALDLYVRDIFKITKLLNFKKKVIGIVKHIKKSQVMTATFEKLQREKTKKYLTLKLPGNTRWSSMYRCLNSLHKTKSSLKEFAIEESIKELRDKEVARSLLDDQFWYNVEMMLLILEPLVKWTTYFQNTKATIGKVITAFNEINTNLKTKIASLKLSKADEKKLLAGAEKRTKKSLHPVHFAANLLEPSIRGVELTESQLVEATSFIFGIIQVNDKYTPDSKILMEEFAEYRAKSGFFSNKFVVDNEGMEAHLWWSGLCSSKKLSAFSRDILNLSSSTAEIERSFSNYAFIHTKRRNRLTVKRAGKISFISFNYNLEMAQRLEKKKRRREEKNTGSEAVNDVLTCVTGDNEDSIAEDTDASVVSESSENSDNIFVQENDSDSENNE